MQNGETKHAHPLEPDAARMGCDGRNRFAYNAQAVVDTRAQIIVATDLVNQAADAAQLAPMLEEAASVREQIGADAKPATLADGGYASGAQLEAAARAGHEVLTPLPSACKDDTDPYHAAHFRHDPERKVVTCPQGRELPLQRVRQRGGHRLEVYRSAQVCKDCPVREHCTSDRHGRTIDIGPGHARIEALRERWRRPGTAEYYQLRSATVEPVFAQVKQQMGFRRWTLRGLENVRVQWAMLCTSWNLQVIYRRWREGRGGAAPRTPHTVPPRPTPAPRRSRPFRAVSYRLPSPLLRFPSFATLSAA